MSTSTVELSNVSAHGLWLLVDERELFLPFDDFPWSRDATIAQLSRIERLGKGHLRWPDLDVDLSLDSIEHLERYPLVSGAGARVRETDEGGTDGRGASS
jgi:hypothetical protein